MFFGYCGQRLIFGTSCGISEWPASAILVLGVSALLKARNTCIHLLNQNLSNQDLIWPRFSVFLSVQSISVLLFASNAPGVGA